MPQRILFMRAYVEQKAHAVFGVGLYLSAVLCAGLW